MCTKLVLLAAILFSYSASSGGVRCRGGRSARGVSSPDELSSAVHGHRLLTASCCNEEDGECHGGYLLAARSLDSIEPTLSRYAQRFNERVQQRRKRAINDEPLPVELNCCSANVSVFFPISALSALTGERVHVIQAPPVMLQAVVFAQCHAANSPLIQADCQQDFGVEMMHVAHFDSETQEMVGKREPVLVEGGCSCRVNPVRVADGPSVHDTVAALFNAW